MVLKGELARKRTLIAKSHNARVIGLLAATLAFLLIVASAVQPKRGNWITRSLLLASLIPMEIYGLYRIIRHDNEMCRELGFLCPFCGQPLYESRALLYNTLCPKCGKDIQPSSTSDSSPQTITGRP